MVEALALALAADLFFRKQLHSSRGTTFAFLPVTLALFIGGGAVPFSSFPLLVAAAVAVAFLLFCFCFCGRNSFRGRCRRAALRLALS